ncbi:MAG: hypothetical protein EBR30_02390 [Cytophagia bacterium]|nr:hypothetical protein [Cytophagia bacterium]NBW33883.1 hypothetical protein [Cytophagia bacterium]
MFVYSTDWYGRKSFRMLPVSEDCPFNEVIYDPNTGVLAVISRDKKDKPQMLPKLTEKGQVIPLKPVANDTQQRYVEERRILETYYEYYLDDKQDIENFINMFAVNVDHPSIAVINEEKQTQA